MAVIRPNAEPAVTTVAAGDIFLIDGATGVRALAATSVPLRDVNGNVPVNNVVEGLTITATAGATTTLTVASTGQQFFTGTLTQTVVLPVVSTLQLGQGYFLQNSSTGTLTVNSSGGNLVTTLVSGASATITCISLTGTSAASWQGSGGSNVSIASGKVLTVSNSLTLVGTDGSTASFGAGGTVAYQGGTLAQFAATTSAQLAGILSDETGTGSAVFATSPALITPALGVANATSVNKVAITTPATGSTLTISDGKTLTARNSLTLAGTDGTTQTFPATSATIARTDAGQTFTGTNAFTGNITTANGAATANSVYSAINPGVIFSDITQSVATIPNGTVLGQRTGVAGYFNNDAPAFDGVSTGTNGVALFGAGIVTRDGGAGWGLNTLLQDAATRTVGTGTGRILIGYENDICLMNPGTELIGVSIGGNSLAQPIVSLGYVVNSLGSLPDGKIRGATISAGGTGYTTATVAFSGGGGTGAAATAQLTGGAVTGITMTNNGTGYTSPPSAVISGNGTGAAVTALLGSSITWGEAFASQSGTSRVGLALGALSDGTSANAGSQDIELGWRDAAGIQQTDVIHSTNGFLQILSTSAAWNGISVGGNLNAANITATTGLTSHGTVTFPDGGTYSSSGLSLANNLNMGSGAIVGPTVIGGSGAGSTLTLESTFGAGTTDAIVFKTGSSVEAARILTNQVFKFGAASFTANGSVATALTSLGPTGSHTTVQTWFTVQDSTGATRFIPAF